MMFFSRSERKTPQYFKNTFTINIDMGARQVESTIPGLRIHMRYRLIIVRIRMQYRSKTIQICKRFWHVPYVWVCRKSAGLLERIRRKYCRPAPANPQKKVQFRSSESTEKSANPLKQIHRKKCGSAQADPHKKVQIHSSRSAEKSADPLVQIC